MMDAIRDEMRRHEAFTNELNALWDNEDGRRVSLALRPAYVETGLWFDEEDERRVTLTLEDGMAPRQAAVEESPNQIEELDLRVGSLTTVSTKCKEICDFIETSPSLRCFDATADAEVSTSITDPFVIAASRNCRIQFLDLLRFTVSATALTQLVRHTTSVSCLVIDKTIVRSLTVEEAADLESAFRKNKTLQSVELNWFRGDNDENPTESLLFCSILRGLRTSKTLKRLEIAGHAWVSSLEASRPFAIY
jgi:hypothetical protein